MTEHEKLKRICDEIEYKLPIRYSIDNIGIYEELDVDVSNISFIKYKRYINIREIIFTPEFKEAFEKELKNRRLYTDERQNQIDNGDKENYVTDEQIEIQCDYAMFGLLYNLHDPVTFLYNLLFNK